ncbi:S8 family serine peptidase [Streptomyces sp. NPDC026673]|uniref:S8 family peptidase n=1 Tax=Streptomyces sp. NPDC026673 TaxID=3155724 RepID=UPI0033CEA66C
MRRSLRRTASAALITALPALALAAPLPSAAEPRPGPAGAIPGQYIVTLDPGTAPGAVLDGLGVRPLFTYRHALPGFAARLTPEQLRRVRAAPGVDEVEQDAVVAIPLGEDAPADSDLEPPYPGEVPGEPTGPVDFPQDPAAPGAPATDPGPDRGSAGGVAPDQGAPQPAPGGEEGPGPAGPDEQQPPEQALPDQAMPGQPEPEQAMPGPAEPDQAVPGQAQPEEAEPDQAGPEESGPEEPGTEQPGTEELGPEQVTDPAPPGASASPRPGTKPVLPQELYSPASPSAPVPDSSGPTRAKAVRGLGGFTPWGLTRINNRALGGSGFSVRATGAKVTSYIVDSGIEFSHPDFGGRAVPGFDAIGDGLDGGDCNGHGTHVAGTVGGSYTGVARKTTLVSVRVFPCVGRTSNSAVVAGIDWVAGNAKKPAVANLSLAGRWSLAVNRAVEGLAKAGVFPVAAAGNDNLNACFVSPASSHAAFTVGAIDQEDRRAWFSNWGTCVDIHAPGRGILSAYLNGTFRDMDGTSMAAPHVTGIAALYKDTHGDASFAALSEWLTGHAVRNVPIDGGYGTARLTAFTNNL